MRIDPGMLRDLRLTTAAVESRPGGEWRPLLGELRVNRGRLRRGGRARAGPCRPGGRARPGDARPARPGPGRDAEPRAGKHAGRLREAQARVGPGPPGARAQAQPGRRSASRPQREVQEAEAELQAAEASLQGARAPRSRRSGADDGRRRRRRAALLRAPIAGTVIDRHLVQGQVAEPAQTLFSSAIAVDALADRACARSATRSACGRERRLASPSPPCPGQSLTGARGRRGQPGRSQLAHDSDPDRAAQPRAASLRPGMSATVWLPVGEGRNRCSRCR